MEYWILGSDSTAKGPYPEERIRQALAQGKLPPNARVCAKGTDEWKMAGAVFGTNAPRAPRPPDAPVAPGVPNALRVPPAMSAGPPAAPPWVEMSFLWPIAALLCCSPVGLIAGTVSIVYAAQANAAGLRGEIPRAVQLARVSKWWVLAAICTGVIFNVGCMAFSMWPA